MKRSEIKELIKEAMLEVLPDLVEIMVESLNENYEQPEPTRVVQTIQQPQQNRSVREHFRAASGVGRGNDYGDLPSPPVRESSHRGPAPNNPKAVIGGETYVSGKGILEWFAKDNGKLVMQPEFKVGKDQMDDFMQKRFGVK